jgi:putative oxidoreductase
MVKFLSRHPDGAAGIALALMRISCALIAFPVLTGPPLRIFLSGPAGLIPAIVALAVAIGLGTRALTLLLACVALADMLGARSGLRLTMLAHAGGYAALVLLGPGAYSLDAMIFGRRVVRLDPRAPDRGTED